MPVAINQLEDSAAGRALELISATNLNKFVDFTSGLVHEVFKTLVGSTLEQLDAYADLVAKVSGTMEMYEQKVLGNVDDTALDYLNNVVLPSFALPDSSGNPLKITKTVTSNVASLTPTPIGFDPAKKSDLLTFFGGVNAPAKELPSASSSSTALVPANVPTSLDQLASFESLLLEDAGSGSTPATLEMATANLHAFAMAKLKRDLKLSYDKLITILKLGMQKIVVTDGTIKTALTFHVGSTDSDERTVSNQQTNTSSRASSWALGGGLSGGRSFGGSLYGFFLKRSFGYAFSGGISSSSAQTSLNVNTVNEKSTAVTTLSFDITGSLELHFRSDFFPSFDPSAMAVKV